MSVGAAIAALCLSVLAALHSYLGERALIGPLLASAEFPALPIRRSFAKRTLRFAWHLTSLAWLALAYMLVRGECSLPVVAVLLALSGLVTHVSSKGRHAAWAVFALGAIAAASSGWSDVFWPRWIALVGALLLAAIGVLHVLWAFGARLGTGAAIPEVEGRPLFSPPPALTLLVALALFGTAWLLLALAQFVPGAMPAIWLWGLGAAAAVVFALRTVGDLRFVGLFKRVRGTRFSRLDDMLYTPLCFALSTALLLQLL